MDLNVRLSGKAVMDWNVKVVVEAPAIVAVLATLVTAVVASTKSQEEIMATQAEILALVQQETSLDQSIITLLQQVAAETDPVVRQQIVDGLTSNIANLSAAVTANTPAATP